MCYHVCNTRLNNSLLLLDQAEWRDSSFFLKQGLGIHSVSALLGALSSQPTRVDFEDDEIDHCDIRDSAVGNVSELLRCGWRI